MTGSELRAQVVDLAQALDDDQVRELVAFAYRLLHDRHDRTPEGGLEALLEDRT